MPTDFAHDDASARMRSRADLTAYLAGFGARIRAEHYMLLAVVHDRDRSDARIIASNWVYDAIQLIGYRHLAAMALGDLTALPGRPCRALRTQDAPLAEAAVDDSTARLLQVLGHAELYGLTLYVGRQRYYLILSSSETGTIDAAGLAAAQLRVCYVLSQAPDLLASASMVDPLTDRERECLFWVSEGKTTDDIAIILSVSANTANGYIANAIQKLGASNRAMAMATALRSGLI
jgi:DNA-binding CsgD family transcriptional regulator